MAEEPSSRLTAAAAELLEAAGVEASAGIQKKMSADIVSLKDSIDAKLNTINQSLVTSRTHLDDKLNTSNQHIVNLETKLTSLEGSIVKESKLQALAFGIENAELQAFEYYEARENSSYYGYHNRKKSSDLVRSILFGFRRNIGWYLPDGAMGEIDKSANKEKWEQSNKDFRDKLVTQIHSLLGTKPRVVKEKDGRYTIYYS